MDEMDGVYFLVAVIHQPNDRLQANDGEGMGMWKEGVIPSPAVYFLHWGSPAKRSQRDCANFFGDSMRISRRTTCLATNPFPDLYGFQGHKAYS